jgi:hypothetical protein
LAFFGLPQGSDRGRALAVGDLDGDKKKDVVVTDPANAQVWVYRQSGRYGLNAGQSFPGLLGGRSARMADLDGDGRDEVYVLSEQEKQIGRSTWENGRLSFPLPLPIKSEPVAMDLADLDGDKVPELLYVVRNKSVNGETFELRALRRERTGNFGGFAWGRPIDSVALTGLPGAPAELKTLDLNRDGQMDILAFCGYGSPLLLLGQKGQPPKIFGDSLGPLASASPASLSVMDLNGPALIVAQSTFARHVLLDAQGRWEIKDQYNAGRSSAQILGAAALDVNGDGKKEIVLLDRPSKSLLFLTLKDGVYRPSDDLSVGSIAFDGMHVADFDSDGRDDLLIAGTDRFGVLQTGRKGQRLKPIASYESKRNEARLADLAAGDVNADGVPDVVFTDIAEQSLEIATYTGEEDLLPALTFKVFERKTFRGIGDLTEPRDLAIGDVDGDGRADIVLIVHDRVLVLRQDPGAPEKKPSQAPAKTATANVEVR